MAVRSTVLGTIARRVDRTPLASVRRRLEFWVAEPVRGFVRMLLKRPEISAVTVRPGLTAARVVAVLVVKDEAPRLPFVLAYYRELGVDHFVVVDNLSTDGLRSLLADEPDVSLFAAEGVYRAARFGNDWLNGLLRRHCTGKWVLWIDADEVLVFSERPGARLPELVAELDRRGQPSLQTLMLDMYSDRSPEDNLVGPGVDPLDVCNRYDRTGYVRYTDPYTRVTWIKGGVRGRLFFPDPWRGPALNKTPLVKWHRHYLFLKSAHELWPPRLNGNGSVEGLLLHFKFTSTSVRKMGDEDVRRQHTAEYDAYADVRRAPFVADVTATFVDGSGPVADGLFRPLV